MVLRDNPVRRSISRIGTSSRKCQRRITLNNAMSITPMSPGQQPGNDQHMGQISVKTYALKGSDLGGNQQRIDQLSPDDRILWLEVVASALSEKVIEATEQRGALIRDNVSLDHILRRFVCDDGIMAVSGAFDRQNVEPDLTT